MAVGLFWAGIGSYVFNNTTMNIDEHGEAVSVGRACAGSLSARSTLCIPVPQKRFKDIVREFLNSNAWAQLKQVRRGCESLDPHLPTSLLSHRTTAPQQFNSCARDWEACFNTVSEHVNVGGLRGAYSVLGLKEGVDFSEVKQARNKLSLKWHPDRCEASKKAQCAKKFRVSWGSMDVGSRGHLTELR